MVSSVTLSADKASPVSKGTTIAFSAQAVGGAAPYQYQWLIFDGRKWTTVSTWSSANKYSWTPTSADPKYQVAVWARSSGSTNDRGEATATVPFVVNNGKGNGKD